MIQVDNILKVLDINSKQLTAETVAIIQQNEPIYRDAVLKEHLYDLDEDSSKDSKEIAELRQLMQDNDAAYVRIIFI